MTLLSLAAVRESTAEGPGLRTAVWFQGCSIRCRGCINPHLFTTAGGVMTTPSSVVDRALGAGSEGLTLLGGEPFDQAGAAADLAELARDRGLGVITFSGFTREELAHRSTETDLLLGATDLLVDGRYESGSAETSRALVGSTNQRFHHLTDRYRWWSEASQRNRVDVVVATDGSVSVSGFLESAQLTQLVSGLGRRTRSSEQTMRTESGT